MSKDLTIHQNCDYTLELTVYQDEAETIVQPLTGFGVPTYCVSAQIAGQTLLKVDGVVSDALNGKVQINLTREQTAALPARKHRHQLFVTDGSNVRQKAVEGVLTVKESLPFE